MTTSIQSLPSCTNLSTQSILSRFSQSKNRDANYDFIGFTAFYHAITASANYVCRKRRRFDGLILKNTK